MNSDLERLERLEQGITQVLYQIDARFSAAHRIITGSVLPLIEQYGEHSNTAWEHSAFWKGFFERSANVAIDGYQEGNTELQDDQEDAEESQDQARDASLLDSDLTRGTITRSNRSMNATAQSPLDLTGDDDEEGRAYHDASNLDDSDLSHTPTRPPGDHSRATAQTPPSQLIHRDPDVSSTPLTSPTQQYPRRTPKSGRSTARKGKLLHRVLDTNWRVQATPLRQESTSPPGSPQLTTDVGRLSLSERTPGKQAQMDDDDDDSSMGQWSPPVTLAFSLPPSKLLRTPAKEAARHMVDDLLRTAGAHDLSSLASQPSHATASVAEGASNRRLFEEDSTPIAKKGGGNLDAWQATQADTWDQSIL